MARLAQIGVGQWGKNLARNFSELADLAWLCGYFLGDGSLGTYRTHTTNAYGTRYEYHGLRLRFNDETVETLQRVQSIILRCFGEKAAIQQDGRGSKGKTLTFTGRKSTGFFAALFDVGPKCRTLRMPEFLWDGGRDLALAFLAGLVDSDGHVAEGRAMYATAAVEFAKDVAVLASLYGLGHLPADDHHFTLPGRRQSRRPDVHLHRAELAGGELANLGGLLVTRPARIAADLLADREDPGAVAQLLADAFRGAHDQPGTVVGAIAPYATRLGLPRGDGLALLEWLLELIDDPERVAWLEEAHAAEGTHHVR